MRSERQIQQDARAQKFVGRRGLLPIKYPDPKTQTGDGTLLVEVEVTEAKVAFGHVKVFVTPVNGKGHWWVLASRVKFTRRVTTGFTRRKQSA